MVITPSPFGPASQRQFRTRPTARSSQAVSTITRAAIAELFRWDQQAAGSRRCNPGRPQLEARWRARSVVPYSSTCCTGARDCSSGSHADCRCHHPHDSVQSSCAFPGSQPVQNLLTDHDGPAQHLKRLGVHKNKAICCSRSTPASRVTDRPECHQHRIGTVAVALSEHLKRQFSPRGGPPEPGRLGGAVPSNWSPSTRAATLHLSEGRGEQKVQAAADHLR